MKKHALWLLLPVVALVGFGYRAGFLGEQVCAVAAPPLSLEGYLDEKLPEARTDKPKMKVDNGACYVCHGNYQEEELTVMHGQDAVGCMDCHGRSFAHRGDEDNITPPEKMYPAGEIDRMCGTCHEGHDVAPMDVIVRWKRRCPTKTDPKTIVCTDCHGQHRLKRRVVRWDKKTGKLIERKTGQATKGAADSPKQQPQKADGKQTRPAPQKR
jgi:hypothetical protein